MPTPEEKGKRRERAAQAASGFFPGEVPLCQQEDQLVCSTRESSLLKPVVRVASFPDTRPPETQGGGDCLPREGWGWWWH